MCIYRYVHIYISILSKVYDGNIVNTFEHVVEFLGKYRDFLFIAPTFKIDPITGIDLHKSATTAAKTAGGLDGCAPADWALLPFKAFDQLAVLLNVIEEGGSLA